MQIIDEQLREIKAKIELFSPQGNADPGRPSQRGNIRKGSPCGRYTDSKIENGRVHYYHATKGWRDFRLS